MSDELTIGEFLCGILPRLQTDRAFPRWPPDCFAICLALLKRTGAYSQLFLDWPPDQGTDGALGKWTGTVRELGGKWRTASPLGGSFNELDTEWRLISESFGLALSSIKQNRPLLEALIKLVGVADKPRKASALLRMAKRKKTTSSWSSPRPCLKPKVRFAGRSTLAV